MQSLKVMYDEFNKLYFNNELPKNIIVEWSDKMTRNAGLYTCKYDRFSDRGVKNDRIALSTPYHNKYPEDTAKTLLHEMIHVKYPKSNHNQTFKKEMERLNRDYNLGITLKSRERALVRYIYTCNKCKAVFKRSNALDLKRYKCYCGGKLSERRVD